jgi:hypothetical protein
MINLRSSQVFLVTLILSLYLGSLIILPVLNAIGMPVLEISEVASENCTLFNLAEFDEEFFIVTVVGTTIAGLIFSKSRPVNIAFQTISLSPHFPPPKHF